MAEQGLQKAGSVVVEELKILTTKDTIIDLNEFFVELNIYEDMFSSHLYGNIVLSDSRNLIEHGPLIGEEYLNVKVRTPTFPIAIQKTFRIFKIDNRKIVRDNNTQMFTLHFASIELFYDILLPLFVPFEGPIHEVAATIFSDYIAASREYTIGSGNNSIQEKEDATPLYILNETDNKVKFVACGWTPFRCLNWLATKAIPKQGDGKAKNYLFFESNKAFYFGSIEYLLKDVVQNQNYIGQYSVSAANIRDGAPSPNIPREMFIAKDVEMIDTTDHVKNYTNGYLASRLLTLDLYNKEYEAVDYDYVEEYKKQFHTSGSGTTSIPSFTSDSLRNFANHISYYPVHSKLFNDFPDNVSEKMKDIYSNRLSSLLDLSNIKMNITVPGRTDIEVGRVLYFSYPALGAADESDISKRKEDAMYSGYYLITAIRHKISKVDHSMIMEIVKDSLYYGGRS